MKKIADAEATFSGWFCIVVSARLQMSWRAVIDPLNWLRPVATDSRVLNIDTRKAQIKDLEALSTLGDSSVPEFLLNAVMTTIDAKQDMIQTLETKAASQIGFAGAIMAIVVSLGRPGMAWPAVVLAFSILANLRAMLVTEYSAPSPLLYNIPSILKDPKNKVRIAASLTESYGRYGLDLGKEAGKKSRYVLTGTFLLVIGMVFVVVSAFLPEKAREFKIVCPKSPCTVTVIQGAKESGTGTARKSGGAPRRL